MSQSTLKRNGNVYSNDYFNLSVVVYAGDQYETLYLTTPKGEYNGRTDGAHKGWIYVPGQTVRIKFAKDWETAIISW